jgi:enoyl-CoA hydratase
MLYPSHHRETEMSIRHEIDGRVGVLIVDRPERANAYDRAHLEALDRAFATLAKSVSVVVLRAEGEGAFCGGADLEEMAQAEPEDAWNLRSQAVFRTIAISPVISIAAIHGPAIGGGFEMALACDLRIVGPRARFGFPETELGIIPAAGGCTHLARHLGVSMAKAVILGGRRIGAEEAVQLGLALQLAEDPQAAAMGLAEELVQRDPMALQLAKQIIDSAPVTESLAAERAAQAVLYERRRDGGEPG